MSVKIITENSSYCNTKKLNIYCKNYFFLSINL